MKRNLLTRPDLAPAAVLFAAACLASREHAMRSNTALVTFGDRGSPISGCVRAHFPRAVKDTLRELARSVTRHSDAAYTARPSRVRMATMRALSRAVAARDGSGYYGPRP